MTRIGCVGCRTNKALKRKDVSFVEEDKEYWYCEGCIKENGLTKIE